MVRGFTWTGLSLFLLQALSLAASWESLSMLLSGQLYVTEALLRSGSVRSFEMSHFSLQNFARTHNTPNNSENYTFLV